MLGSIPKKYLENITDKLKKLSNYKLKEDGLKPISKDLILKTWPIINLYGDFLKERGLESANIQVFPIKAGGLTIEFNENDYSLELMFKNEGESEFWLGDDGEFNLDGEFSIDDKETIMGLFSSLHGLQVFEP